MTRSSCLHLKEKNKHIFKATVTVDFLLLAVGTNSDQFRKPNRKFFRDIDILVMTFVSNLLASEMDFCLA